MTSSVMADSPLFLEEAMASRGRNLDNLDKCKERTREIFSTGVQTLTSTKPGNKVKLCLGSQNPETTKNEWRIMWKEMDNDNVFTLPKKKQTFKPNAPDSDWGNQIFKLKANKLDDGASSMEGTFVIAYFSGGKRLVTKSLTIKVED